METKILQGNKLQIIQHNMTLIFSQLETKQIRKALKVIQMDEDLIPYYNCKVCGGKICKGDVGTFLNSKDVVCIDCEAEE